MFKAIGNFFGRKDRLIAEMQQVIRARGQEGDELSDKVDDLRIKLHETETLLHTKEQEVVELQEVLASFSDLDSVPMQPITLVPDGVPRFVANTLVEHLVIRSRITLEQLLRISAPAHDKAQLLQLVGTSISRYGKISHVSNKSHIAARAKAKAVQKRANTAAISTLNVAEESLLKFQSQQKPSDPIKTHGLKREVRSNPALVAPYGSAKGGLKKGELQTVSSGVGVGRSVSKQHDDMYAVNAATTAAILTLELDATCQAIANQADTSVTVHETRSSCEPVETRSYESSPSPDYSSPSDSSSPASGDY